MKSILITGICSFMLLMNSCSENELILRPTFSELPMQSRDGGGDLVCNLIQATYDVLNSTETTLSDWIDPDFFYLADLTNPTAPQISQMHSYIHDAIQNLSAENEDFESAFNALVGMNLSQEEFDAYAEECSTNREARWCLFCDTTACGNSIMIASVGINTNSAGTTLVGFIGHWLHCDH
ncbi:MAG TPA: hypothetical protein VFF90_05950 [Saprospiraceae bacterium]|nr:hypothetical protein [Saprospiraceae bacterium]